MPLREAPVVTAGVPVVAGERDAAEEEDGGNVGEEDGEIVADPLEVGVPEEEGGGEGRDEGEATGVPVDVGTPEPLFVGDIVTDGVPLGVREGVGEPLGVGEDDGVDDGVMRDWMLRPWKVKFVTLPPPASQEENTEARMPLVAKWVGMSCVTLASR